MLNNTLKVINLNLMYWVEYYTTLYINLIRFVSKVLSLFSLVCNIVIYKRLVIRKVRICCWVVFKIKGK